jgi:hypothetical protein
MDRMSDRAIYEEGLAEYAGIAKWEQKHVKRVSVTCPSCGHVWQDIRRAVPLTFCPNCPKGR